MPEIEEHTSPEWTRLEPKLWDYVRAGWWVTHRSARRVVLEKDDDPAQTVTLRINDEDQIVVEGPDLPGFVIEGRMRAWLALMAILILVFAVAWAIGYFR